MCASGSGQAAAGKRQGASGRGQATGGKRQGASDLLLRIFLDGVLELDGLPLARKLGRQHVRRQDWRHACPRQRQKRNCGFVWHEG